MYRLVTYFTNFEYILDAINCHRSINKCVCRVRLFHARRNSYARREKTRIRLLRENVIMNAKIGKPR